MSNNVALIEFPDGVTIVPAMIGLGWIFGSGEPAASMGRNTERYFDGESGAVWKKENGIWIDTGTTLALTAEVEAAVAAAQALVDSATEAAAQSAAEAYASELDAAASAAAAAGAAAAELTAVRKNSRVLSGPAWRGGYTASGASSFRMPEVTDLKNIQAGLYGDLFVAEWFRMFGIPVEAELYNTDLQDSQIAIAKALDLHNPRIMLFSSPTYLMDDVIPRALLKKVIMRSASPGIGGPPTMLYENPLHTPFSFGPGNDNIRFDGVWSIKHRIKPGSGVYTMSFDGCRNIYIDTLVCLNANQALRFNDCDNIFIGHLVTDADIAFAANGTATNVTIARHTKIGSGANAVTGGQYVNVLTPSSGIWTPLATFATVGDLSMAHASNTAIFRRIGNRVYIRGSVTFTPTYTAASGSLQLGGLPFPVRAGSEGFGIDINSVSAFTWPGSTTQIRLTAVAGQSYMNVQGLKSGAAPSVASHTSFPTGVSITMRFAGTYETEY